MISVEQALEITQNNSVNTTGYKQVSVHDAIGGYLFNDIISPINMPPFRQSAMDGYAICLHDQLVYSIVGEVKAGDPHQLKLNKGEAIRIFTGAAVPDSANAVIMQEKTVVKNDKLTIDSQISHNRNIRPLGEQIIKNQTALKKGTKLTPAAIAFLTSLGITKINIFKKPSIAIVVTGNELISAGEPLVYGQIYESNGTMLKAALVDLNFQNVSIFNVNDNYNDTLNLLNTVISNYDVILVSGGISVGDYDFVGKALKELKVEELFYKVKQKPGKPLFFGKKGNKVVFALPGNPAAALSCFYIYVYSVLQKMSGDRSFSLTKVKASSLSSYIKKGDRAQFLKAIYNNGKVELLEGQNSSMLHTFALANALVFFPENSISIKLDDIVDVILLPIN